MKEVKRMAWVLGWAIPVQWFEHRVLSTYPNDKHTFINASPDFILDLKASAPYDHIIGYSLGSLLILLNEAKVKPLASEITLISPILGFLREMGMGGTTPRVKLKYAMREFKINPIKACINFYALTGLNVSEALIESLHLDHLSWGLDQLETNIITSPVPLYCNVYVGKLDPLSDTVLLKNNIPQLRCIDEATHDPTLLIKAIEKVTQ